MSQPKVIDWTLALEQVGQDESFLLEVLNDLIHEIDVGVVDIQSGIDKSDFDTVRKVAHRIKGSASYLNCDHLQKISFELQNAGDKGDRGTGKASELWAQIKELFADLKTAFEDLKAEIATRFK